MFLQKIMRIIMFKYKENKNNLKPRNPGCQTFVGLRVPTHLWFKATNPFRLTVSRDNLSLIFAFKGT